MRQTVHYYLDTKTAVRHIRIRILVLVSGFCVRSEGVSRLSNTRVGIWVVASVLVAASALMPATGVAGWKHNNERIKGSGRVVQKVLDLEGFDRIRIDAVADVNIKIGPEFSVVLEAEDNIIDHIDVDVAGGKLVIDMDDRYSIDTDENIHFEITMPELEGLIFRGVGDVRVTNLNAKELEIECPGVGKLYCQGKAKRVDIDFSGVGTMDLGDLATSRARVRVDGVGTVVVNVEDDLDVDVNGMGTVRYYGNPGNVRSSVSGFGRISRAK